VVLTDHQESLIGSLVDSGRYQNASEVLREGLRLLEQRVAEDAARLEALREAVDIGLRDLDEGRFQPVGTRAEIADLLDSPEPPASRARDEIRPGIRTFHIARRGQPARHLFVYRVAPDGSIQIIRLLHDAMELSGALRDAD
jgi:antitoxin ParD1/3/4